VPLFKRFGSGAVGVHDVQEFWRVDSSSAVLFEDFGEAVDASRIADMAFC